MVLVISQMCSQIPILFQIREELLDDLSHLHKETASDVKQGAWVLAKLTELPTELTEHAVETGSDILVDLAKKYSEKTDDEDVAYEATAKSVGFFLSIQK